MQQQGAPLLQRQIHYLLKMRSGKIETKGHALVDVQAILRHQAGKTFCIHHHGNIVEARFDIETTQHWEPLQLIECLRAADEGRGGWLDASFYRPQVCT